MAEVSGAHSECCRPLEHDTQATPARNKHAFLFLMSLLASAILSCTGVQTSTEPGKHDRPTTRSPAATDQATPDADGNTLHIAALELASVLPLPGDLASYVRNHQGRVIGIHLTPGPDRRRQIVAGRHQRPRKPSDLIITFEHSELGVGTVYSKEGLSIPIAMDVTRDGHVSAYMDWPRGLLVMLRDEGRTVRLSGKIIIKVADPTRRVVTHVLEYQCGRHATIAWDTRANTLVWSGITVTDGQGG